MKVIDNVMMRHLSFPDFDVISTNYSVDEKTLIITVEGGYLDLDEGILLDEGKLYFYQWDSLHIKRYNSTVIISVFSSTE